MGRWYSILLVVHRAVVATIYNPCLFTLFASIPSFHFYDFPRYFSCVGIYCVGCVSVVRFCHSLQLPIFPLKDLQLVGKMHLPREVNRTRLEVFEGERERERERERESVCVWERERECVCVCERERERECVCVCEREVCVCTFLPETFKWPGFLQSVPYGSQHILYQTTVEANWIEEKSQLVLICIYVLIFFSFCWAISLQLLATI